MTTTTDFVDGVAVIRIDNPPVNAGDASQRAGVLGALTTALAAGADAIVIASAGRHFYAGSDLREFDGPIASPTLPDLIALIEEATVPVAAAMNGLALGGGLELALACDRRVADESARLGFPEVSFGLLPGAGGTVRATRLIGVPATIDLVTSSRQVAAAEAHALGLVDRLVPQPDLIPSAIALVRELTGRDRVRDRPVPPASQEDVATALASIPKRARPHVRSAGETVVRGAELEVTLALQEERALFETLRRAPEAQDLRYLFFATQAATRSLLATAKPRAVRKVGIVGAGTMGASLARSFSAAHFDVTIVDNRQPALDAVHETTPEVSTGTEIEAIAGSDLVIDAVFEDLSVKQRLLQQVEPLLAHDAVIASNTSYLDLNEMAQVLNEPSRFGGLHFFNPPDRNRLVEVIAAADTSESTLATLGQIVKRLSKVGIPAGVGDGFAANRVYADYRLQAEFLVLEGAAPEEVDAAMVDFGFAIGPFAVADMSGLDIAWARRKRLAMTRDPRERYVAIADRLCEAGRLGRKTGAGWYDYPNGARRGQPSREVSAIIGRERAKAGVEARRHDAQSIQRRILGAMLAGALEVLTTRVAHRASDVDVALVEGFAFPRHRGGPLRTLSRYSESELAAVCLAVYESDPVHYAALAASDGRVPRAVSDVLAGVRATAPH